MVLTNYSEWIRDVQLIQLEIFLEFDRICSLHNLKYQLFAGTLLGAIRHKGFIPWDDDLDVCMLRADYEAFLEVCGKELNSNYFLQTNITDSGYNNMFAKIRKNNTKYVENMTSDCEIHQGIFIDVFPFDNVMPKKLAGLFQQKSLYFLGSMNKKRIKKRCFSVNSLPKKFVNLFSYYCLRAIPKRWIDSILMRLARMFEHKDTEYVSCVANGEPYVWYLSYMTDKVSFENIMIWEFEGHLCPVPVNYNEVLTKMYGDYMVMPPPEERKPHHGITEVSLSTKQ